MFSEINNSLLTIIVNRGKGSRVMNFLNKIGAGEASCLLGRGTISSSTLEMIEMNDVSREIILLTLPSKSENDIFEQLNHELHLDKPNHGIAFSMPLSGIMKIKRDPSILWQSRLAEYTNEYTALFVITDKGQAEDIIRISQDSGFYGGTIIKSRCAGGSHCLLNINIEPANELTLLIAKKTRAKELAKIIGSHINENSGGLLFITEISRVSGLYDNQTGD